MAEHVWREHYENHFLVAFICARCDAEIIPVVVICPTAEVDEVRAQLEPGRTVWGMNHLPAGHRELMWGQVLARITGQPPCTPRAIESGP